jgi:hypothetical protein
VGVEYCICIACDVCIVVCVVLRALRVPFSAHPNTHHPPLNCSQVAGQLRAAMADAAGDAVAAIKPGAQKMAR